MLSKYKKEVFEYKMKQTNNRSENTLSASHSTLPLAKVTNSVMFNREVRL